MKETSETNADTCLQICDDAFGYRNDCAVSVQRKNRRAVWLVCGGQCRHYADYADLSAFCSVCGSYKNCNCRILCYGKKRIVLHSDLHRTCFDAGFDADTPASVWRADHDLVEHGVCKNPNSSTGCAPDTKK